MDEFKTREQKAKFYSSYRWRMLSKKIKQRDNNECQECKRQGRVFIDDGRLNKKGTRKKIQMVTHHKIELEDDPSLRWTESNLETLCTTCHNRLHNRHYQFSGFEIKRNRFHEDEKW